VTTINNNSTTQLHISLFNTIKSPMLVMLSTSHTPYCIYQFIAVVSERRIFIYLFI